MKTNTLCSLLTDPRYVELVSRLKANAEAITGLEAQNMVELAERRGMKKGIEASIQFLTLLDKKGAGNGATI